LGVTDGDTIRVLKDGKEVKIRLEGIDAPERGQDFGNKAKEFTSEKVFGKEIEIREAGTDRYGRTLARVYVSGKDLSLELVRNGLAWHFKRYSSDTTLARAELDARFRRVGLWSQPNPVAPWDFRYSRVKGRK
jgi:micrococcal nuclease